MPFFFTVKQLAAKSSASGITPGTEFGGTFTVPSYRSGLFLDPKVAHLALPVASTIGFS